MPRRCAKEMFSSNKQNMIKSSFKLIPTATFPGFFLLNSLSRKFATAKIILPVVFVVDFPVTPVCNKCQLLGLVAGSGVGETSSSVR